MSDRGFYVETKDFDEKFAKLIKETIPEIAAAGLFTAANAMLTDAEDEAEKVPWKTGDLRASREIQPPDVGSDKISVTGGYNIEYAARLHEGEPTWNWTQEKAGGGVGPKFLEKKMIKHAKKYMKICADFIKARSVGRGA